jgi:hypothetical protein
MVLRSWVQKILRKGFVSRPWKTLGQLALHHSLYGFSSNWLRVLQRVQAAGRKRHDECWQTKGKEKAFG